MNADDCLPGCQVHNDDDECTYAVDVIDPEGQLTIDDKPGPVARVEVSGLADDFARVDITVNAIVVDLDGLAKFRDQCLPELRTAVDRAEPVYREWHRLTRWEAVA